MNKTILACLLAFAPACKTTPEGETVPDWPKIEAISDEVISQLDFQIKLRADRPEDVDRLTQVRDVVLEIDAALEAMASGEEPPVTFEDHLTIAKGLLDRWIQEADPSDTGLISTLGAIRAGVGLITILTA